MPGLALESKNFSGKNRILDNAENKNCTIAFSWLLWNLFHNFFQPTMNDMIQQNLLITPSMVM